jgi:methanogenic corrinoid protein MtbC1
LTATIAEDVVHEYLAIALSGARYEAVRFALGLLDDGVPEATIVTDLLGAAQHEVGVRWHHHEWSTADEHLVTSVSQAVLEALSSTGAGAATEGAVVVACAEGDWHALPSQMFAELLRGHGQGTVYLGASTPADDVADYLSRRRPDALAVTCSLALSYLGTARLVDAAHQVGLPVIVGGSALTGERAAALGADAWGPDVGTAAAVLRGWRQAPPVVDRAPVPLDPAALELESQAEELADRAFEDLSRRFPPMRRYDGRQLRRTREDLAYIVRYLAASRLVGDPTVFTSFRSWIVDLLEARGVPERAFTAGAASLAPLVRAVDDQAFQVLTS